MNTKKTTLTLATTAAFAATASLVPFAHAADNPFGMAKLGSGYQLAQANMGDKKTDGSCGGSKTKDGNCGANKVPAAADKKADGNCGANKAKDGNCGANKKPAAVADKKKDGKCGEAKCGANK